MKEWTFLSRCEADTDRLGAILARHLPTAAVVTLSGPLGAGKTRLVQAIGASWGIPREEIVSPTFVLCREYPIDRNSQPLTFYHLDAYRIRDDDEFRELGDMEYYEAPAVTFIEWPERVADCLPDERLAIEIVAASESQREFRLRAMGPIYEQALNAIALGP